MKEDEKDAREQQDHHNTRRQILLGGSATAVKWSSNMALPSIQVPRLHLKDPPPARERKSFKTLAEGFLR